jgi:hexosaminidase
MSGPIFSLPFPRIALVLLAWVLVVGAAPPSALTLIPYPSEVQAGQGNLLVHNGFRIFHEGPPDPLVDGALERFTDRLSRKTGIRFVAPRAEAAAMATLRVRTRAVTPEWPGVREDEAYVLELSPEGAVLEAANAFGVRHGLETFLQLVRFGESGAEAPAVRIQDRPRFPWRGLLLDPVRHFLPLDVVKREVDAIAAVKLNVLHFRFADDQAFRVESKRFPLLHEKGGEGQYYTQAEIRELVEYARQRGIRVVPEFCVPGHTAGWLVGYPEFGSRPGPYTLIRSFGIFEPTMDPTNEELYRFLDVFFGEMAELFPDPFVHIGGDEITGKHWAETPRIRSFMEARGFAGWQDLQAHFNQRLLPLLTAHGKRVIGWDEVLHPQLPRSIVVQSWRGQKELAASVRAGHEGILSSGYYLDLMLPAESHYAVDPLLAGADALTAEQAGMVLGGEAAAWSEFITAENLDLKLWPRLAAVAERLWSPREQTEVAFLYRRFSGLLHDLAWMGVDPAGVRRRMLARAAGPENVGDLEEASDFLEPVKRYYRADSGDYTVFRPLNRLVDSLWPESLAARSLRLDTEAAAGGSGGTRDRERLLGIAARFGRIQEAARRAATVATGSALLRDARADLEALAETARLGGEAARLLAERSALPGGWMLQARRTLDAQKARQGEILNLLISPVATLLDALQQEETGIRAGEAPRQ